MIGHEIITASAGSGKTWNLVVRYIRLLILGAAPRSIIALTFSRKAAGEFFSAILHRLAKAAQSEEGADSLARDAMAPHARREDFVRLLVDLVREMPQLTLGTMDAFFVRMARSFPLELGLAGDFALLDTHRLGIEQDRVLRRVFAPGRSQEEGRREFLLAFQQATWGKDEVRLKRLIHEFLRNWQELYLQAPDAAVWGNPAAIWPQGRPAPDQKMSELIGAARTAVERTGDLKPSQAELLGQFLTYLETYTPGTPIPSPHKGLLKKFIAALPDLAAGNARITIDRVKTDVRYPLAQGLRDVVLRLVDDVFMVVLHQTRGIHRILTLYDRYYHGLVRRQGMLTFHDVQLILSGDLAVNGEVLAGAARENIDYRLDARYTHWLLDEFQDTSRVQWRVIQNLCDEVIQDQEGDRTFFAVGDEKQSIFTWRGAEPGLFGEILDYYNGGGHEQIKVTPLALSQRSGPAIIRMVNRLCGNLPQLQAIEEIAGGVARWPWQEHASARPDRKGCAALIEVPALGEADTDTSVWRACADLLQDLQPLRRGLTCAVLCGRNQRAAEIADVLRKYSGMEVVCESDVGIATDNPAASALLSLLKAAAHPSDQYSWHHANMSPLGEIIAARWPETGDAATPLARLRVRRAAFTAVTLAEIAADGFEKTLRRWADRLFRHLPALDSFSRGRIDELCRLAQEFDQTGSRDVDEFLAFAEAQSMRESACPGAVQVMTLHKSKGLTFDVVILPDLHDRFYNMNRIGVGRGDQRRIEWLSILPASDIAKADPVFSAALDEADATLWRERLAQLYVSVTRARHGNYLLVPPDGSSSTTFAAIARDTLLRGPAQDFTIGGRNCQLLDLEGDLDWIDEWKIPESKALVTGDLFASLPPAGPARSERPGKPMVRVRASAWHYDSRRRGRDFGTLVHALLSTVEWAGPETEQAMIKHFTALIPQPEEWQAAALQTARECVKSPALREVFIQPEAGAGLWRERAFEALLDGECASGVFDRVILLQGEARLIEFKTDEVKSAEEAVAASSTYAGQLQIYRSALVKLTGLPLDRIRTWAVFTSVPCLVEPAL